MNTNIPRLKFTQNEKIKIKKDWADLLPEMATKPKTSTIEFGRMVGPLMIKLLLEIENYTLSYTPKYIVYNNLASKTPLPELYGVLGYFLHNTPHDSYSIIEQAEHEHKYPISARLIKEKVWLPLEGNITLDKIFGAYVQASKYQAQKKQQTVDPRIREWVTKLWNNEEFARVRLEYGDLGSSFATPALVATWAGEPERAREYLEWACKVYSPDPSIFRNKVESLINNPQDLRAKVRANRIKYKMDYAPYQDIVGVPYKETWSD